MIKDKFRRCILLLPDIDGRRRVEEGHLPASSSPASCRGARRPKPTVSLREWFIVLLRRDLGICPLLIKLTD